VSTSYVLRHAAAVLIGYLLFALSAAALFALAHRDPHVPQDAAFVGFSLVYGVLAAMLAGYVAASIGRGRPVSHARTLSLAIAAVAIVSLLSRPGGGAIWSQLASLFLFAPSALVGGWLRSLKR
jgi:peptidoglycan/LPS O-acetylase OafA/YrhL